MTRDTSGRPGDRDPFGNGDGTSAAVDPLAEYGTLRTALRAAPGWTIPALESEPGEPTAIAIEDLVDAEVISVHEAPTMVAAADGDTPLLSAKDVRLGRAPSRWGNAAALGSVTVRTDDVAVVVGTEAAVRLCTDDGVLLGPGIRLLRVARPGTLDPRFLAGVLRAAVAEENLADLYKVEIPRIAIAEQRRYSAVFEQLDALETGCRRQLGDIEQLVRIGLRGLARGALRPVVDG